MISLSKVRQHFETDVELSVPAGKKGQAAVLLALTDREYHPSVILTRRSPHLSSHSGEVSLPGGKWDRGDDSLHDTALRETEEEIGVSRDNVEVLGSLPVLQTWRGIDVLPVVGVVPGNLDYTPNPAELDAIFHVPLSFFAVDKRIRTDCFERTLGHRWSPAYDYNGYEIWGLTARILCMFFSRALGVKIPQENPAPVKLWSGRAKQAS